MNDAKPFAPLTLLIALAMLAPVDRVPAESPGAGLFTPPASDSPAAAGPLDPAKMPQIGGIHLGTPLNEARTVLQKLYAGHTFEALNGMPIGPQHRSVTAHFFGQIDNTGTSGSDVDITYPPNAQLVWHMARITRQQHVAHDVLVNALRAKYGKETLALAGNSDLPVTTDRQIVTMFWQFDEQGRLMTSTKAANGSPYGCAKYVSANGSNSNLYIDLVLDRSNIPPGYCRDSFVVLTATLANRDILDILYMDMVDLPLAVRSAQATAAWNKGLMDKAAQQEKERAKSVQPAL